MKTPRNKPHLFFRDGQWLCASRYGYLQGATWRDAWARYQWVVSV